MINAMPKGKAPYLSREKTRHDKWVWYFRRGKQRVRIRAEYGTPEFWQTYTSLLEGKTYVVKKEPTSGTLSWLVSRYKESGHFASLRPSTRRMRDNILKGVCKTSGDVQFIRITKKQIQLGMDRRSATPHAANNFLKVMSSLFKWAVANEMMPINPCATVERRKDKIRGHHTWSLEEVAQFRDFHKVGTKARLAIDLLLFTGLRRSDIVIVGRQHVKGSTISIRTEKSEVWVYVPIFPELKQSIDQTQTGDLAFLTSGTGKPFGSPASFGNWFRKRRVESGLHDDCTPHGLRKAGATIAANNGASPHELMAMYGWKRLTEAEVYTREADKVRLARGAAERIANNATSHLEPAGVAPSNKIN